MQKTLYPKTTVEKVVSESTSVTEVARKLKELAGLPYTGDISYISKLLNQYGVDRSHFINPRTRVVRPGDRFSRLIVITDAPRNRKNQLCWVCICDCGKEKVVLHTSLHMGETRSCGCLAKEVRVASGKRSGERIKGPKHPRWKGGRRKTPEGYVFVIREGHPRARKRTPYVLEHVLVMERKLGRYLLPGETVHHKNGVRDDNREENLELMVSLHPSGQRAEDLIAHAVTILTRYAPDLLK